MSKPKYPGCTEVVPGVFISVGDAVYIADEKGEVVTWNADEVAEDGEAFTAALNGVILAALYGADAVRDNISSHGERLEELITSTLLGCGPKQPKRVAIESLVIDGESVYDGTMGGMDKGEDNFRPPYALFSPDLQANVGGPYASYDHAEAAKEVMLKGGMVPYTNDSTVTWTVKGKPSSWYDKD
jgi:hypothetical protein